MLKIDDLMQSYPEFANIINLISEQNPLQKKRINNFISSQDLDYWKYAEEICYRLSRTFLKNREEQIEAARSYNRMSMDFLREQIRFSKTGVYRLDNASSAEKDVYNNPEVMRYYMVGLFLSYLLWPNHFKILCFLRKYVDRLKDIKRYIDIAPGHGLFAMEVIKKFPEIMAVLLDISDTSIMMTNEILSAFGIKEKNFRFINGDFLSAHIDEKEFDFITMGEVLEHVNNAPDFLKRVNAILKKEGSVFMSTCANCPAIDHVYHFHNIEEIRDLIQDSGFSIVNDVALPAEAVSQEECQKRFITVNYCAILEKRNRVR